MKKLFILIFLFCVSGSYFSCKNRVPSGDEPMPLVSVKASPLMKGDVVNIISFNGSTVYLKKNLISSPISGYITRVGVKFGDEVRNNQILFEIQTKERKALPGLDSSGNFGTVSVLSSSEGFINDLAFSEPGGYVAEGETLCSIADNKDLMVRVNVPFEYNSILTRGRKCTILLTDNTVIEGSVARILPVVDDVNQTQAVLIKPETGRPLPENLNLIIKFLNEKHQQTFIVSRSSLLTNETQTEFWIMRISAGDMAVKIPVSKGIENDSIVEIISPLLNVNDLIINEGAYGLPDSTAVEVVK